MKRFKYIYKECTKTTGFDILRTVDIYTIKEIIMNTEPFENVLVLNTPKLSGDKSEYLTTLFRPNIDKLNKVVNISTIQLLEHGYEPVLMINCLDGTVIRPEDE